MRGTFLPAPGLRLRLRCIVSSARGSRFHFANSLEMLLNPKLLHFCVSAIVSRATQNSMLGKQDWGKSLCLVAAAAHRTCLVCAAKSNSMSGRVWGAVGLCHRVSDSAKQDYCIIAKTFSTKLKEKKKVASRSSHRGTRAALIHSHLFLPHIGKLNQ